MRVGWDRTKRFSVLEPEVSQSGKGTQLLGQQPPPSSHLQHTQLHPWGTKPLNPQAARSEHSQNPL